MAQPADYSHCAHSITAGNKCLVLFEIGVAGYDASSERVGTRYQRDDGKERVVSLGCSSRHLRCQSQHAMRCCIVPLYLGRTEHILQKVHDLLLFGNDSATNTITVLYFKIHHKTPPGQLPLSHDWPSQPHQLPTSSYLLFSTRQS